MVIAVVAMLLYSVAVNPAFAAYPKEDSYSWVPPKVAMRYTTTFKGRTYHYNHHCAPKHYAVFSKYTGLRCESKKYDRKAAKWLTKCSGSVFISWIIGGSTPRSVIASGTGCAWTSMMN